MFKNFLLVGFGGGIGSMLRYTASLMINARYYPLSTLAVNIIGCFIIGVVVGISTKDESFLYNWKLFLATGICGGFTTFSSFSSENMELMQAGRYALALTYICASVVLGIAATWFGYKLLNT